VPVEQLKTYYDLSLEHRARLHSRSSYVSSRFWFFPIVSRVNVIGDLVLLEKFQMGVFTEVLHAELDGKPVAELDRFEHAPSEGFSRSFTENYGAVAQEREALETLRGLTTLAALAKGLAGTSVAHTGDFWITRYGLERRETPSQVDILAREDRDLRMRIAGGVQLKAVSIRVDPKDPLSVIVLTLKSRPQNGALTWRFDIEMTGVLVIGTGAPGPADPAAVSELLCQGAFLYHKKRYDSGAECYTRVLRLSPGLGEALHGRGACRFQQGAYDKAITEFRLAIEKDPTNFGARWGLAMALLQKRDTKGSLEQLEQLGKMLPSDARAWTGKGFVYLHLGGYPKSLECFDKALALAPALYDARLGRAWALYFVGDATGKMEQVRASLAVFGELAREHPDRVEPVLGTAYVLGSKELDSPGLLLATQRAIQMAPEGDEILGVLWFLRAQAESNLNMETSARASARKAEEHMKRMSSPLESVVRCLAPDL